MDRIELAKRYGAQLAKDEFEKQAGYFEGRSDENVRSTAEKGTRLNRILGTALMGTTGAGIGGMLGEITQPRFRRTGLWGMGIGGALGGLGGYLLGRRGDIETQRAAVDELKDRALKERMRQQFGM